MVEAATADLTAAHDEVVTLIRTMPDVALDWQPGGTDWSVRQIVSHLAHANDFYVMIVDEVHVSKFGTARLHRELPGVQRMAATDAEVAGCTTVLATLDCFERAYQRMWTVLNALTPEELDRPFVLYSWQPDAGPETTSLRQRVIRRATEHLQEHQAQLKDTLTRWQATHTA